MKITDAQIRSIIRESLERQMLLEREDIDPGEEEFQRDLRAKALQKDAERLATQYQFQQGNVPNGTKLAIKDEGEPMVVKIGTVDINGSKHTVGKIYSNAKGFDAVAEGYGSYLTRDMLLSGKFEYPAEFGYVTDCLSGIGNKYLVKKSLDSSSNGDFYKTLSLFRTINEANEIVKSPDVDDPYIYMRGSDGWYTRRNNWPKDKPWVKMRPELKMFAAAVQKLNKAYPNLSIPTPNVVKAGQTNSAPGNKFSVSRRRLDKGDPSAFYHLTGLFVMKTAPGTWKKPVFRSTTAGLEASQKFQCMLSKAEVFKLILKIGDEKLSDEEIERVIPCFAAVSDSIMYDISSTIIAAAVSSVGTPTAGIATYAIAQIVPAVPVLIYHIAKKNWGAAAFYLSKIALSIFGSATKKLGKAIILGLLEAVMSILHMFSMSITDSEKQLIMSHIKGETLQDINMNLAGSSSDPQGFIKIYTQL